MTAKFVWTPTLCGPRPEIWHRGIYTRDMLTVNPLQEHLITDEEAELPLDKLAERFPYVPPVEETAQ